MTYREAKYVQARINGATQVAAAQQAGFSVWLGRNATAQIETDEMREQIQKLQAELVQNTFQAGLITATEIHEYLTDAIRADWCDIENDDGTFKPISEWPLIWRQMKEAGDIEVEYEATRSHDGQDAQGLGGWDRDGLVRKVKIKFASRVKLIELAMKHKGVDALAVERQQVDINVTAEITAKLQGALRRKALIDVTPETRE